MKIKVYDRQNKKRGPSSYYVEARRGKPTRYRGVYLKPKRKNKVWIVKFCYLTRYYHVGSYETEDIAAWAYDQVAEQVLKIDDLNRIHVPELSNVTIPPDVQDQVQKRIIELQKQITDVDYSPPRQYVPKPPKAPKPKKVKVYPISREDLERDSKTLTMRELSVKYGISLGKVETCFAAYKLPKVPFLEQLQNRGFTKELLFRELVENNVNISAFVVAYGIPRTTLRRLIKHYKLDLDEREKRHVSTCPRCGQEFYKSSNKKIACSEQCSRALGKRRRHRRNRLKKLQSQPVSVCKGCGVHYCSLHIDHLQFCSAECRKRYTRLTKKELKEKSRLRTCQTCGVSFFSKTPKQYCSNKCSPKPPVHPRDCKVCGKPFVPSRGKGAGLRKTCSVECDKENRRQNHEHWRSDPHNKRKMRIARNLYGRTLRQNRDRKWEFRKELKKIRQQLKTKGKKSEYIEDIIERLDHFGERVCCFCREKQDEDLTIEHIVPISAGGDNRVSNILGACRVCNESKWYHEWKSWFQAQSFYSVDKELEIEALADKSLVFDASMSKRRTDFIPPGTKIDPEDKSSVP